MTTPVLQSGLITPGHIAKWITDGVIADAGIFPPISETILAQALSANFNSTSDQQIAIPTTYINKFALTRILVTNANVDLSTSTIPLGGFYPTISKGGTPIVAAAQSYVTLTTTAALLSCTLASYGSTNAFATSSSYTGVLLTNASIYFSLSTAHGTAATADIYICGFVLA